MDDLCANCEESSLTDPFRADGEVYCCTGCSLGGPCVCTYDADSMDRHEEFTPVGALWQREA